MTNKRIKSYLEDRLKRLESIRNEREWTTSELGDIACCKQTLAFIDSMQEESEDDWKYSIAERLGVSKDEFDKMKPVSEPIDIEQELYKAFGQVKDFTLGMQIAKRFYEMGKQHQEPASGDLGEYINELSKQFPEVSFAKLSRIAVRVAKWQKQQDQSTIELAEDHAMLAGMEKMKEQMMAKAIDVEVKVDAGGYPYIPQMELYDYDKDIPLAKEGDKYKVILIKQIEL